MAKSKKEKDTAPSFEHDLEQLEGIVNALEEGGLSLDDSLKRFEDGIRLARRCEKALTDAEKRIEILLKNADGELEAQPFGEETAERATAASHEILDEEEEPEEEGELLF